MQILTSRTHFTFDMPTVVYSRADSLEIKLDYDVPHSITSVSLGAVVYLHGGGIISGSRRDVFYPSSMKGARSATYELTLE